MSTFLSPINALGASRDHTSGEYLAEEYLADSNLDPQLGKRATLSSFLKLKGKDKKERRAWLKNLRRDRPIYPRGWFFIFLGVGIGLVGAAFALVEFAILSTALVIAAIVCGVLALFFLTRWLGYYWRY